MPPYASVALTCLLVIVILVLLRLRAVLAPRSRPKTRNIPSSATSTDTPLALRTANRTIPHLVIVLGSGGHTAEMIAMLTRATTRPVEHTDSDNDLRLSNSVEPKLGDQSVDTSYLDWSRIERRTWIVSAGDSLSASAAHNFEQSHATTSGGSANDKTASVVSKNYSISIVPRARKIHQSLSSAPFSCARCLLACLSVLTQRSQSCGRSEPSRSQTDGNVNAITNTNWTPASDPKPKQNPHRKHSQGERHVPPDLILSNGPATATIVILAAVLLRFIDYESAHTNRTLRTVYVESFARVKSLSLSGRILLFLADRVIVQWASLDGVGGRGEFLGVLV